MSCPAFFVISGFCIHSPQAMRSARGGDGVNWSSFMIRRLVRIWPPYLAAMALNLAGLFVTPRVSGYDWNRFQVSLLMLQNHWPPEGQISDNPSLWSLPVEVGLYLIYPLAWLVWRRFGWACVFVGAALITLVRQLASLQGFRWFEGSFAGFWAAWCAGARVAEKRSQSTLPKWNAKRGWGLILAIMTSVVCEVHPGLKVLSFWFWGLVGVFLLVWAAEPVGKTGTSDRASRWMMACSAKGTIPTRST